jgi:hypothetical protein
MSTEDWANSNKKLFFEKLHRTCVLTTVSISSSFLKLKMSTTCEGNKFSTHFIQIVAM